MKITGYVAGDRAPGGGIVNVTGDRNDEMDSWKNITPRPARWYEDNDGRGSCSTLGADDSDNNVAFWNSDQLSSWATNGGC